MSRKVPSADPIPPPSALAPEPITMRLPGTPLPPRHQIPSFLALRFYQICLGILSEILEPVGLKQNEYGALTILHGEPGIDQRRLASVLGVDPVSVGQIIDNLERRGLMERRVHATDRRARALFLTPAGLELRLRLRPAGLAGQEKIMSPLSPDERVTLIDLLTRIVDGHEIYVRPGNGRRRPQKKQTPT